MGNRPCHICKQYCPWFIHVCEKNLTRDLWVFKSRDWDRSVFYVWRRYLIITIVTMSSWLVGHCPAFCPINFNTQTTILISFSHRYCNLFRETFHLFGPGVWFNPKVWACRLCIYWSHVRGSTAEVSATVADISKHFSNFARIFLKHSMYSNPDRVTARVTFHCTLGSDGRWKM
jgi:hypothetical protein